MNIFCRFGIHIPIFKEDEDFDIDQSRGYYYRTCYCGKKLISKFDEQFIEDVSEEKIKEHWAESRYLVIMWRLRTYKRNMRSFIYNLKLNPFYWFGRFRKYVITEYREGLK